MEGFKVVELTDSIINDSLKEDRIDGFEDAIQFHSAEEKSQVFVTRNIRHFRSVRDALETISPREFIRKYPI